MAKNDGNPMKILSSAYFNRSKTLNVTLLFIWQTYLQIVWFETIKES